MFSAPEDFSQFPFNYAYSMLWIDDRQDVCDVFVFVVLWVYDDSVCSLSSLPISKYFTIFEYVALCR